MFAFMMNNPKLLHLSSPFVQLSLFKKKKKSVLTALVNLFLLPVSQLLALFFSPSCLFPLIFSGLGNLIIKLVRTPSSLVVTSLGMWVAEPLLLVKWVSCCV